MDRGRSASEWAAFLPSAEAILEATSDGYLQFDRDYRLTYANRAASWILGLAPEAMVGATIWETWPMTVGSEIEPVLRRAVEDRIPDEIEYHYYEPDRYDLWVEIRVLPHRDGAAAFFRDAAERRRTTAEREELLARLDAERRRLHLMFAQSPAFIAVVTGPEFRFEYANDRYYELIGHREVLGKTLFDALPEVAGQGFDDLLRDVMETGDPWFGDEVPVSLQRTPQGPPEERFIALAYQPVHEPDGTISGVYSHGVDVTDLVVARRKVEEINAELEARVEERTAELVAKIEELQGFTHAVAHDLRSPLRAMVSNARIVQEDEEERLSVEGREGLERIVRNALRMSTLVDDLLQYARIGARDLDRERVDLTALAEEVAADVARERPEARLHFTAEPGLRVEADARLLRMALHNLLDNAAKYRKPDGRAVVTLRRTEEGFELADDGIGFDMAYVGKLFRPFERLHRDEYPGTGIGLANVRRAIERHDGTISARAVPGEGATFVFTL